MVEDDGTLSEIIVQGDDQQVEQMRKDLKFSEKGMVYVKGLFEIWLKKSQYSRTECKEMSDLDLKQIATAGAQEPNVCEQFKQPADSFDILLQAHQCSSLK